MLAIVRSDRCEQMYERTCGMTSPESSAIVAPSGHVARATAATGCDSCSCRSAFLPYMAPMPSAVAEGSTPSESHVSAAGSRAAQSSEMRIIARGLEQPYESKPRSKALAVELCRLRSDPPHGADGGPKNVKLAPRGLLEPLIDLTCIFSRYWQSAHPASGIREGGAQS